MTPEQPDEKQPLNRPGPIRFLAKPSAFWLLGIALFVLAFLLGFYLWLPVDILGSRLVRELERHSALKISVGKLSLSPLLTLYGDNLSMQVPQLPASPLMIEHFKLKPRWFSLLTSDQAFNFQAQLLSGTLGGSVSRSSALQVTGSDLKFMAPLQTQSPLAVAGTLTSGKINSAYVLRKDTISRVELDFDRVLLQGVGVVSEGSDGLLLGTIQLQANGKGRAFKIERLLASGGDVEAKGEGTLLVTGNPQDSLINLSLNLRTTAKTAPEVTSLLELIGKRQADGAFLVKLGGTLSSPVMSP